MAVDDRETTFARSLKFFQEGLRKSGAAMLAGYMLIASILAFGAIGYGLDLWLDRSPWFLLGGLLLGIVVGFVELARIIWRR